MNKLFLLFVLVWVGLASYWTGLKHGTGKLYQELSYGHSLEPPKSNPSEIKAPGTKSALESNGRKTPSALTEGRTSSPSQKNDQEKIYCSKLARTIPLSKCPPSFNFAKIWTTRP